MMKIYQFCLVIIFAIFMSCTSETTPFKPQHIEKITDDKDFIKRMLQQPMTRISNGMFNALIYRNFIGTFYLTPTTTTKLSQECETVSNCLGVVYVSVNKIEEEHSNIMYRIYPRSISLNLDCTWVESYDVTFSEMNEKLIKQVEGRTLEWVNACFAN